MKKFDRAVRRVNGGLSREEMVMEVEEVLMNFEREEFVSIKRRNKSRKTYRE